MTVLEIRSLCSEDTIMMTEHIVLRCRQRGIRYGDIEQAILTGEIIEEYQSDYPYPSCLILGSTICGKYLHVVAGIGENKLWITTAYYPDPAKWEKDLKTRKAVKI